MPLPSDTSVNAAAGAALFYLFGGMAVASAVGVVAARNIVRAAVCLLFALLGVGGLYLLLDAEFLAAVQLVVYAGGTLILIIFGVMLTSTSPFSRFEPSRGQTIVGVALGAILFAALGVTVINAFGHGGAVPAADGGTSAAAQTSPQALGQALLGDYLLPFELSSVLLLVVMIGAAFLAKGRRRQTGAFR